MVKTIAHRELRNNSSDILRQVQSGETFNITNHGEIVATLVPADTKIQREHLVRHASIHGRWEEIPTVESDISSDEIMNELRGER